MAADVLLARVLFLFGIGFLAANVKVIADLLRFWRRRSSALLIWQNPKPRYYGFTLALGVVLGLLLAFKLFYQRRPPNQLFGELAVGGWALTASGVCSGGPASSGSKHRRQRAS